jgi:hypothetical protein
VINQKNMDEGVVALSSPVDLSVVTQSLAAHTSAAALVGLGTPVVLVGSAPPPTARTFPLKLGAQSKLGGLSIAAALDTPATAAKAATPVVSYARYACWGLAGLLLVVFGVSRARRS